MTKLTIGSYTIETQKMYDLLNAKKVTSDADIKKYDKNNDMKISEDELVELIEEDEETSGNSAKKSESSSSSSTSPSIDDMIDSYSQTILSLETKLNSIYSRLGTAKDFEETDELTSELKEVLSEIKSNREQVYNLLLQKESGTNTNIYTTGTTSTTSSGGVVTPIISGNDYSSAVVSIAQSYVGKLKETDGSYLQVTGGRREAWCADFVTHCVKKAAEATGKNIKGFGSPAVATLREWGKANKCYQSINGMSNSQKANYIANNVKPGDVVIMENNYSHTGLVTKVYSDGSYDTIEGNSSDQCRKRHYSANYGPTSGFIRMS